MCHSCGSHTGDLSQFLSPDNTLAVHRNPIGNLKGSIAWEKCSQAFAWRMNDTHTEKICRLWFHRGFSIFNMLFCSATGFSNRGSAGSSPWTVVQGQKSTKLRAARPFRKIHFIKGLCRKTSRSKFLGHLVPSVSAGDAVVRGVGKEVFGIGSNLPGPID